MVLRVAREFGVSVAALHHALEAYRVPDLVRSSNATVATFADMWGYKWEAYNASVDAPRILAEHGIPVALKSDHPVINAASAACAVCLAHLLTCHAISNTWCTRLPRHITTDCRRSCPWPV